MVDCFGFELATGLASSATAAGLACGKGLLAGAFGAGAAGATGFAFATGALAGAALAAGAFAGVAFGAGTGADLGLEALAFAATLTAGFLPGAGALVTLDAVFNGTFFAGGLALAGDLEADFTGVLEGFAAAAALLAGAAFLIAGFFTGTFFATALLVAGLATGLLLAAGFFATTLLTTLAGAFAGWTFASLPAGFECAFGVLLATVPPAKFHLCLQVINGKT